MTDKRILHEWQRMAAEQHEEIERLRARAEKAEQEWATIKAGVEPLYEENVRLRTLCQDVGDSGVELEDERLSYVVAQIPVETWKACKALAATRPDDRLAAAAERVGRAHAQALERLGDTPAEETSDE